MSQETSGKKSKTRDQADDSEAIYRLSDQELERHLRVFMNRITVYSALFPIDSNILENMRKQQAALSWMQEISGKLEKYTADIRELKKNARGMSQPSVLNMLSFLDLPRPPVFYFEGDIAKKFSRIVTFVKSSGNYTEGIGRDLGIEHF